jgi:hypothetical protein
LTKFEPREIERLAIPSLEMLAYCRSRQNGPPPNWTTKLG